LQYSGYMCFCSVMATVTVARLSRRIFVLSHHSCRCFSNANQQQEQLPSEQTPRMRQKVTIVTEEEAASIRRAADSQTNRFSAFDDPLVSKFINCMMWDGKKDISRNIMKSAFKRVNEMQIAKRDKSEEPESIEVNPLTIFYTAIENSKPAIGCQTVKKGGKNYSVPTPLPDSRRRFLAMKWMITAARDQSGPKDAKMYNKLAKEIIDAYNNEGTVIRKKIELHKVAEANRAFAHFRWW